MLKVGAEISIQSLRDACVLVYIAWCCLLLLLLSSSALILYFGSPKEQSFRLLPRYGLQTSPLKADMIPSNNMSSHVSKDPEMGPMDDTITTIPHYPASSTTADEHGEKAIGPITGHMMSAQDPDNPQNWPIHRRAYVSAVAVAFAFVV